MNRIVASISLGAAVCITASAFAQDSHLSLTRQSVASMHEIAAALDKVTDEPGAAAAVETVKKFIKSCWTLGKDSWSFLVPRFRSRLRFPPR
ncbi:hypothetical protein M5E88_08215 [Akkermansia muciniphila]|nr:hypothetical protein M5E88_08215 [Akkermansia muciniphila]